MTFLHLCLTGRHFCLTKRHLCLTGRHLCLTGRHLCLIERHLCLTGRHLCLTGWHKFRIGIPKSGSGSNQDCAPAPCWSSALSAGAAVLGQIARHSCLVWIWIISIYDFLQHQYIHSEATSRRPSVNMIAHAGPLPPLLGGWPNLQSECTPCERHKWRTTENVELQFCLYFRSGSQYYANSCVV